MAELKQYDVGRLNPHSSYARLYPVQVPVDGSRIPTLDEVIALFRRRQDETTHLWIEIKTSPDELSLSSRPEAVAKKVVAVLRRESYIQRSKILSFDWRSLVDVQNIAPDIQTVYLSTTSAGSDTIRKGRPESSPWTAGLDIDDFGGSIPRLIKALGGRFWAPRYTQISLDRIKEAHGLDLGVFVWTVDSTEDMERLVKMGVDGIITNRPDILLKERR
jgi:glycerophosphoryl diester phosphodiesterase